MKCDIIIPIWNQLNYTKACIENIVKNTSYPYHLILIDNASDSETKNYLQNMSRVGLGDTSPRVDVAVIRNEENLGFVKAVNQGLRISDAPYVCVLNNDTIPAPGWLERMIDFAEQHKDMGLINPQCDGHGDTAIETYARMLEKNKGKFMEMNQCQGFCMLIKREVIDKIGYLDESFGIGGFDDTDYSMRAHKAGYRSVSVSDAYVYHRLHASFDKAGDREGWVKKNQKIYYDKWGKHLRIGIPVGLNNLDDTIVSNVIKFAHGMAREWSWVHIWINFRGKNPVKKSIDENLKKSGLPPHQNIRVDYFGLPDILFSLMISGKLVERMRRRMRDKRFDALIPFTDRAIVFLSPVARALKVLMVNPPADEDSRDWYREGREIASLIKEKRDRK